MKRTRLTGVLAATALLVGLGLASPATAEPGPTPGPATTAPAEDRVQPAATPAITEYAAKNTWVGTPTSAEIELLPGVIMRKYTGATIYWSAKTGAHAVHGGILAKYSAYSQPLDVFGIPVSEELVHTPTAIYQVFTKDTLYWTPQYGTHAVGAAVAAAWQANGGADRLGFPTTDVATTGTRTVQQFQFGGIAVDAGKVSVALDGIGRQWVAQGGLASPQGYPTSNETALPNGGVTQKFSGGTFYYSPASGAFSVHGGIGAIFDRNGGVNGLLGFPSSPEVPTAGNGVVQHFTGGAVYWSPTTGSHPVFGAIGGLYRANGAEWGRYGLPTSDEVPMADGGVYQSFQGGRIYWSPSGGVYAVQGSIATYWQANGGPTGRFGQAISAEVCNNAGCYQNFQGGAITWGPMTGAHDMNKLDARCTYGRAVCADKTTNKMYWVINGQIQGTWDVRFGAPGWETANGEMVIFRKEAMSWSVPFSAWMPWSQYFHASGMAIHYSSGFEAEGFPSWGSHGCINMNDYAGAQWLFNQTVHGDRIVVYYS